MTRSLLTSRLVLAALLALAAIRPVAAAETVPFRATWAGHTVYAIPTPDPAVVFVFSTGSGQATHLGQYTLDSPHFSHLDSGFAEGEQILTAANGDQVFATFEGYFSPTPDGFLSADLEATIVGGTGRFEGASGSYTFSILFDPATFQSIATIDGTISHP